MSGFDTSGIFANSFGISISLQWLLLLLFGLTTLILLWYYLYYFARIVFYKEADRLPTANCSALGGPTADCLPCSIIICAKNEDHNLPEFLPPLLSQDYPQYEVVVVNDCSWDNTMDVLREFEKKEEYANRLKVITIKEDEKHSHGKKFALMVGIKGAKYEHLLLTDADCKPASNQWLKKMMSAYILNEHDFAKSIDVSSALGGQHRDSGDAAEIILGYSPYEKHPGILNKLIRFDAFHIAMQYLSFALAKRPYMGTGRNLAYRKHLFFKHKGFATHYHIESGDDDLFINQAATGTNTRIEISPESFTVSRVKKDWKGWVEQKRRHLATWKEYKLSDKFRLGIYLFANALFWLLFAALLFSVFQAGDFMRKEIYFFIGIFFLKLIIQIIIFKLAMNRLQEKDLLLTLFFAEIFLLCLYPSLTLSNWFLRRKKWK